MTELMDRLRAADPVREALVPPPIEPLLGRLDPSPPARRPRRRLVPAIALVALLAALVVLTRGSSPDVVAEARAALGGPDELVHTVFRVENIDNRGRPRSSNQIMR